MSRTSAPSAPIGVITTTLLPIAVGGAGAAQPQRDVGDDRSTESSIADVCRWLDAGRDRVAVRARVSVLATAADPIGRTTDTARWTAVASSSPRD
jgi:hypothetical protein